MIPGVYSRPAQPGEIISLYGTGLGPVSLPAPNTLITLPIALGVPGTSCEYYMSIGGQPYFATSPYSPPTSQPSLPGNTVVAWMFLLFTDHCSLAFAQQRCQHRQQRLRNDFGAFGSGVNEIGRAHV